MSKRYHALRDVVCSLPHYRDHVLPIFEALPSSMQGTVHPLRFPVHPDEPRA